MAPVYCEVRVAGIVPPEALLDFEQLTASVQGIVTVVHGRLQDQAAVSGLLARLTASRIESCTCVVAVARNRPRLGVQRGTLVGVAVLLLGWGRAPDLVVAARSPYRLSGLWPGPDSEADLAELAGICPG